MLELFGAHTGNSYRAAIALYEAELPFVPRGPSCMEADGERKTSKLA
jgi:hypothetical protein